MYQGTKEVMTPKISIVTELAQMALLRPNLSETNPEQNEPSPCPRGGVPDSPVGGGGRSQVWQLYPQDRDAKFIGKLRNSLVIPIKFTLGFS